VLDKNITKHNKGHGINGEVNMDRDQIKNVVSGVLVVDKPIGLTSHDVVQIIRRGTGIRRAGHTGTLDPRASGVLVVLIGPAVRLSEYVSASDKRYQATIRLGSSTNTYDSEGAVTGSASFDGITEEQFLEALQGFEGEIQQAPPEVVIDVYCSSGTYVRSLANDLGNALGTGAHLIGLRRTRSGRFTLRDAVPLRRLKEAFQAGDWYKYLIPAADALGDWPAVELDPDQVELVRHGHRIEAEPGSKGWARGISTQGDLVALLELDPESGEWQPRKVFFQT
jgi:tRNA pseudouridine55 synthase